MNHSFYVSCLVLAMALPTAGCLGTDTESPAGDSGADGAVDAGADSALPRDSSVPDASGDAALPDTGVGDASPDALVDGGEDGAVDGGDGGAVDGGDDAGPDAGDAGVGACSAEAPCGDGDYCDYDGAGSCGADGALGMCASRPSFCTDLFAPVCGCDGVTYGNDCDARAAGVDVASTGECDCRETGCSTGSSCQECLGSGGSVWVCLGDGTAC